MVKRSSLLTAMLLASCALIDAANGPFEPVTCAYVDCDCVYDVGCDPQYSCDAAFDCRTCEVDSDCQASVCGIDGVCLGCQPYVADFGANFSYDTSAELYYCQDSPSPTCVRSSCVTFQ